MQEQAQATNGLIQFLNDNWFWIGPAVLVLWDTVWHWIPGKYQSKLKKLYDFGREKLKKK